MLYLRHFKNFLEAKLDYDKPVTIVIGPNGSGKSNLIEGIELLAFLASGRPLHEVTDIGREGGLEIRGGLDACPSRGQSQFTLEFKGPIMVAGQTHLIDYEISVRVGKRPQIVSEHLGIEGTDKFEFAARSGGENSPSTDNEVTYDNHAKGKNKPQTAIAGDRSALSQYARFASGNRQLSKTLPIVDAVISALGAPAVFDPIPKLMRGYERESETQLARNGFNISPVLANLSQNRSHLKRDEKTGKYSLESLSQLEIAEGILKQISQLPDEPFSKLAFIQTKAKDVMFGFKTPTNDEPITARVLSDGTLRALAVLAALETSAKGRHLIIEEFDNGVHPSRVQILTKALFDCSKRNDLRSLVTTHNPATLNALTKDQLSAVLFVVQDPATKHARVIPLTELPGYIEFVEKGRLGDLVTRRVYEQHLSDNYEDQRKTDINQWLEALP